MQGWLAGGGDLLLVQQIGVCGGEGEGVVPATSSAAAVLPRRLEIFNLRGKRQIARIFAAREKCRAAQTAGARRLCRGGKAVLPRRQSGLAASAKRFCRGDKAVLPRRESGFAAAAKSGRQNRSHSFQ